MSTRVYGYPNSNILNGRYQPESASSGKTHTTASGHRSGVGHRTSNAPAVCSELSNGKEALLNRSPAAGTGGPNNCNFSTMSEASRDRLGQWPAESDGEVAGEVTGFARLRNGRFNKGLAFTIEERQALGIHGLLPAIVRTEAEQVQHCLTLLNRYENDLDKYIYLVGLMDRNERLFYRVLASDIGNMMPLVYTPTVGLACQKFSLIYQQPKGMYITINDKGHVYDVLKNWPEKDVLPSVSPTANASLDWVIWVPTEWVFPLESLPFTRLWQESSRTSACQ